MSRRLLTAGITAFVLAGLLLLLLAVAQLAYLQGSGTTTSTGIRGIVPPQTVGNRGGSLFPLVLLAAVGSLLAATFSARRRWALAKVAAWISIALVAVTLFAASILISGAAVPEEQVLQAPLTDAEGRALDLTIAVSVGAALAELAGLLLCGRSRRPI